MTKHFSPHVFALCSLFVLGNIIVIMPFALKDIFVFALFCVVSLILTITMCFVIKQAKHNLPFNFLLFILLAISVYGAAITFVDFLIFLKSIQLNQTNILLLTLTLFAIVIFFALQKLSTIYKYGLLVAVVIGAIILLCGIFSVKNFDVSLFKTSIVPTDYNFKVFFKFFLPIITLPVLFGFDEKSARSVFYGCVTGFFVLFLCFLQTTLTFSDTSAVNFPYLRAIGVISSGSLFTRLDGLVYIIFFVTTMIKITLCIKTVEKIFNFLTSKKQGI